MSYNDMSHEGAWHAGKIYGVPAPRNQHSLKKMSTPQNQTSIGPDILANGKKDWSRYNATIVGAQWVPNQPANPGGLPGLDMAPKQPYRMVSFGAKREYGPEEGWIKVGRNGKRLKFQYVDHEPVADE